MENKWRFEGHPIACESGDWDGKRSEEVVAVDEYGVKHIARVYAGAMGGNDLVDWVDQNDDMIDARIVKWIYIPN